MNASAMFVTYDGLLDPLGGSQILPYLCSIAQHPRPLHILSFEKPDRFAAGGARLRQELTQRGIGWTPLSFTARFGKLGKLWDLGRMYLWGAYLAAVHRVKVVHARGHPPAQIGLFLKRMLGTKLIFDFRGLWVDERVDKGGWDLRHPVHRLQYAYFKRVEHKLLANSDQIVVLTDAVVDEVVRLGAKQAAKITVIPCCADFEHFPLVTLQRRQAARASALIPEEALVLGYLGSVGHMYMLDRFFRLFELAAAQHPTAHALLITQDVDALKAVIGRSLPLSLQGRAHICPANRTEVPHLIAAMNVLVSFIQHSYARRAASPTKLAECFAEGIPAICNAGVGDIAAHMQRLDAGLIVDPNSDDELRAAVVQLGDIQAKGGARLRDKAREILGLEVAVSRYQTVYTTLK